MHSRPHENLCILTTWILLCFPGPALLLRAGEEPEPIPLYNIRPYLQSLTQNSVLIVTQSKETLIARLTYGLTADMPITQREEVPGTDHVFRLEGLSPDTLYHYRIFHENDTTFPRATFRTLGGPGSEVTIALVGDSGTASEEQVALAQQMLAYSPDLFLHTGDIVYSYGSPSNYYNKFFKIYRDLIAQTCFYPSMGNHDCSLDPKYWHNYFHTPANNPAADESYYSFDAGDAHFAVINSCTYEVPPEQIDWLDQDLARTQQKWKIVYFHHAPYSNALHGGTVEVRNVVVPVVEKHNVDLVLAGHDHVYERSFPIREGKLVDGYQDPDYVSPRGVLYVVSAGGGAKLYPYIPSPEVHLNAFFKSAHHYLALRITPDLIEGRAIGLENEVIDAFTLRKSLELRPTFSFVRGDVNEDGNVDITDAVAILQYLFSGAVPPCLAACDVDNSGGTGITDAVYGLGFLFQGGPPPVPPYPDCGPSEGADNTGCRTNCP